ncbi:MAG: hypothetical protein AAGG01_07885 [Planctomycetota bacterium]
MTSQKGTSGPVARSPTADGEEGKVAETLLGDGRVKWTDVAPGPWTLTIEAEGQPRWRRELTLEPGKYRRTTAYIGSELRITGEVRDTNGDPVPNKTAVHFIAPDLKPEPGQGAGKDGQGGKGASLSESVFFAVATNSEGAFKAVLPAAGRYQLAVGNVRGSSGKRWTQVGTSELTHGGPDHVVCTVPAHSSIALRWEGDAEERPKSVRVYAFDADRAARAAEAEAARPPGPTPEDLEKARQEAIAEAIREVGEKGSRNPGIEVGDPYDLIPDGLKATGSKAEPIFAPGWYSLIGKAFPAAGDAVFKNLPEEQDLRFQFQRGGHLSATASPIQLKGGKALLGTVQLPPLMTGTQATLDNLATLQLSFEEPVDATSLPTGLEWTIRAR